MSRIECKYISRDIGALIAGALIAGALSTKRPRANGLPSQIDGALVNL